MKKMSPMPIKIVESMLDFIDSLKVTDNENKEELSIVEARNTNVVKATMLCSIDAPPEALMKNMEINNQKPK